MRAALFAAIAALAITTNAAAEDLALLCQGSGTHPQASFGNATVADPMTGNSATVTSSRTTTANLDAAVRFEMSGDTARILMPPAMTPPINGGSEGGWWNVTGLEVTPQAITGRFSLNPLNRPRVRIDRMAGTIEVDGSFRYYFLGQCEAIQTATAPRF